MMLAPFVDRFVHWHGINLRNAVLVVAFSCAGRPLADWWAWPSSSIRRRT